MCFIYMESRGLEGRFNVGPFTAFEIKPKQKVTIKKGSVVNSTHPSYPIAGKVLKKDQVVTVHDVDKGYVYESKVTNGAVHWVGAGSYYMWTDIDNVTNNIK